MRPAPTALRRVRLHARSLRRPILLAAISFLTFVVASAFSKNQTLHQAVQQKPPAAADVKALQQKAAKGDAEAQFELGKYFFLRCEPPIPPDSPDCVRAAEWFRKAAQQGHVGAQLSLGNAYLGGLGVPQNDAKAVDWLRKAAKQGATVGQWTLGQMYANGKGVSQDYAQAAAWYRKAAEQGDEVAQYFLGLSYENGQGVPQDPVEALKWLNLAVARATDQVEVSMFAAARDALSTKISAAQLDEGQKRASEWTAAFAKRKK